MSIPLDRLYHFIEQTAREIYGDAVTIYRFFPHGSKKQEDLTPLIELSFDWFENITRPTMICHDQEPLNFNLYNFPEKSLNNVVSTLGGWVKKSQAVSEMFSQMHLRSSLAWPLNCYNLVLLCHSEKNSRELEIYENNGFVGVYWWSHAIISRDWFRYAQHDPVLTVKFDLIEKDFLIYNRAWSGSREYRLKLTELLADQDLVKNCKVKFCPIDNETNYINHNFKNLSLKIKRTDLHDLFEKNTYESHASADYENIDYATTGIELVLETLFDDDRWHLTEKTLRPIACGRPFLLAATPNSLKYLKSYGFQTFGDYIDESYDSKNDPLDRLTLLIKEMKRICNLDTVKKQELWNKLYKISKVNQELFFSKNLQNQIVSEYQKNLQQALIVMNQNKTGKYLQLITREKQKNSKFAETVSPVVGKPRSPEDLLRLYRHIGVTV